jgi:hypothetical protein
VVATGRLDHPIKSARPTPDNKKPPRQLGAADYKQSLEV